MRVAAIDIGTNSVLLLIAELTGTELVPVLERATITRLGQGVDASRTLSPEAVNRTLACLTAYGDAIRASGVKKVDIVGTSAMRDARGGDDFRDRVRTLLGVAPRVISGDDEAQLTFEGALSGLSVASGVITVFDVGGGSTEIITQSRANEVRAVSLDIGSVRLTERHVHHDPPTANELGAVRSDVRSALSGAPRPDGVSVLVGVAGTVTTLAAVHAGIEPYDGSRVHGTRMSQEQIQSITAELATTPLEARCRLRGLDPARADVIVAGAVLVEEIVMWSAARELVASDRGVRWGVAARLARSG